MRICIIGGGKVGFYLAKTLLEHGHDPVVVEQQEEAGEKLANSLDIPVIHGDGTSLDTLQAVDLAHCQALVCVSGKDEVNLVAAQLAKKVFSVKRTIVRVNNPKNTEILRKLGIDFVLSSTQNIVRLIEHQVESSAIRHLMGMGGDASLVEIILPAHFRYDGQTLAEIRTPKNSVVVSIFRKDNFIIPDGETKIAAGDRVMLVTSEDALHQLIKNWKIEDK